MSLKITDHKMTFIVGCNIEIPQEDSPVSGSDLADVFEEVAKEVRNRFGRAMVKFRISPNDGKIVVTAVNLNDCDPE